jgi:hypothetical protein
MSVIELEASRAEIMSEKDVFLLEVGRVLTEAGVVEDKESTVSLADDFYDFYPDFAIGTVRSARLAMEGADVVNGFGLGIPVNKGLAVKAAILTDIGKADESLRAVVQKSAEGRGWTRSDHDGIKPHARLGCEKAIRAGQYAVAPVIGEHHGAQAEPYGMGLSLTPEQRVARDLDAATDFFEAMFMRNTSRNRGMSPAAKLLQSYNHMERYVYNHEIYQDRGPALAGALVTRFAEILPAEAEAA